MICEIATKFTSLSMRKHLKIYGESDTKFSFVQHIIIPKPMAYESSREFCECTTEGEILRKCFIASTCKLFTFLLCRHKLKEIYL